MRLGQLMNKTCHLTVRDNQLRIGDVPPRDLMAEFGTPLYVYFEDILRATCRRLKGMVTYPQFRINYSVKANSNIQLLRIIREEGIQADAMSPGEILLEEKAGFAPDQIFFIPNNADPEEFAYGVAKGVRISVDSLDQLELYGRRFPGTKVAVRINPGIGDGHHEKVVTGGDKSKFGVPVVHLEQVKSIAERYGLVVHGLNMHIGSNYLLPNNYLAATDVMLDAAKGFPELEFLDIGGGYGISYTGLEPELDLEGLGRQLDERFYRFANEYGRMIEFIVEPGRYTVVECGLLLSTVRDVKRNPTRTFVGTEAGFQVLMRPMAYGAYHEIVNCDNVEGPRVPVDVAGNICESGDLMAADRPLTETRVGDALAFLDAGAYGYSMASNYNARMRPAEILVRTDGSIGLIRRRDTFEDLLANQIY